MLYIIRNIKLFHLQCDCQLVYRSIMINIDLHHRFTFKIRSEMNVFDRSEQAFNLDL